MAMAGGLRPAGGTAGTSSSATADLPKYFAQFTGSALPGPTIQVRSTSNGSVIASAPSPKARGWLLVPNTVAASPDGRTFYVDYDAARAVKSSFVNQIWIYRLSITSSGSATPLARIDGGTISGSAARGTGGSMAVSPDGTKLALTADTTNQLERNSRGWADKIILIDLRTGARTAWQGGLARPGKVFTIPDVSWTGDGRSLVFLGLWCDPPAAASLCGGTPDRQEYRDTQVRSLSVAEGGGTLDHGAVLLRQSARYPVIADAIAGPDPGQLTLVVLSGRPGQYGSWSKVAVDHVSAADGSLVAMEYRSAARGDGGWQPSGVEVNPDPGGRSLLFSYAGPGGLYTGWLGGEWFISSRSSSRIWGRRLRPGERAAGVIPRLVRYKRNDLCGNGGKRPGGDRRSLSMWA